MVHKLHLSARVTFIDVLPYEQMMEYTRRCFLGLIFEKVDVTDQHLYALPNKFFDYIKAGIPVLSSKATEVKLLIDKYKIGDFITSFNPSKIADKILDISKDEIAYNIWKQNTIAAAKDLNWENEEKILINFMKRLS